MNFGIGVDIGGSFVRACVKDRGVVMNESSAWAVRGEEMVACGDEAYALIGRAPRPLEVLFPVKGGAIADERAMAGWLKYLIDETHQTRGMGRARLVIARSPAMGKAQMKQLVAMALDAGAAACALVRSDVLSALGAGRRVDAARGSFVVDVGAHSVDAALIVMNRVVASESLPYGVASIDQAVQRMLISKYRLSVGPRTAEAVKRSLAATAKNADVREQVAGLDLVSGFPRTVDVASGDINEAMEPLLAQIAMLCERVMLSLDHEYAEELLSDGIVLTGGGASAHGIAQMVSEATGVPCLVADDPALAVARGLMKIIENPDPYERLCEAHQSILERRLPVVRR